MNIKQALKLKNKLVTQIKEQYEIAKAHNSIEQGNPRRYSALQSINKANELSIELVELKTKIHRANATVYDNIFRLSELKSMASRLKSLNCQEGKVTRGRWDSELPPSIMVAEIGIVERDEMVKHIEAQIEEIQDILDTHNAVTEI
jgi:hypothetical protein